MTTEEVLKSEEVKVSIHRKPFCLIELEVKVGKKWVDEARKEAIKAVSKEVVLPGFRKGRAPEQTILKRYPQYVDKELHKTLANVAYREGQKIAKMPLLNHNSEISFNLKSHSPEEAELVFSFETEPEIPKVDPKLFVPRPVKKAEVGEKQVEEAIRQMRFFFAEWTPIKDRPIQDGDYIMIDLDTIEGEKTTKVFNDVRFEVSKERMAGWMQKLVQGAKWGDVLEGISEADETASEEEKKEFQQKQVRLSILKVEEALLPEVNDEFAKKVGAQTVTEMYESVKKMLNAQAEQGQREALHEQVNHFLMEEYPFELPQSLVKTEKEHRKEQWLKNTLHQKRWEQIMTLEEKQKIEQKWMEEADQAVRLFYLARSIVHEANLPITQQEVHQEAVETIRAWGQRTQTEIPKEVIALALSKVILAKAEEYIIQNASSEKPPMVESEQ